jgi:hypothetical protein
LIDEQRAAKDAYHLLALQQPVGSEFTSANSASVGRHFVAFVTAMWLTARNTILKNMRAVFSILQALLVHVQR